MLSSSDWHYLLKFEGYKANISCYFKVCMSQDRLGLGAVLGQLILLRVAVAANLWSFTGRLTDFCTVAQCLSAELLCCLCSTLKRVLKFVRPGREETSSAGCHDTR